MRLSPGVLVLLSTLSLAIGGCSSEEGGAGSAAASVNKSAAPAASAKPTPPAASTPAPSASAAPRSDCPKDSSGPGTFDQPCAGKGTARMMAAKWTGKTDDKGPYFAVENQSPATILFGRIVVYFYDKTGKQLEVQDKGKAAPYKVCSGNIFSGVMKVKEKATITFSCVKKEDVPEGAAAIEAELQTVGFADASDKKVEFYWTNKDLVPDARPKGGVK